MSLGARLSRYLRAGLPLALVVLLPALALAGPEAEESEPLPAVGGPEAALYVLSNSAPHITRIDGQTHEVVASATVADHGRWGWNDENNYFDGTHLWAGAVRDGQGEVLVIDLDSLEVLERIGVGAEETSLYIGKATAAGRLFVGKHASWQMAIIDVAERRLLQVVDVPTNGEAVGSPAAATCDADVGHGADGAERVFYPTRDGDTVVALDGATGRPLVTASFPGQRPLMLTVAPLDGTVWVQEARTNTNAVLDPTTLEVIARFATPRVPLLAAFSPDGALGYVTGADTFVTVVDAATHSVQRTVEVGSDATKAAAHPNGRFVFAQVTKENAVAVIDTESWQVVRRIDVGTQPDAVFVRAL